MELNLSALHDDADHVYVFEDTSFKELAAESQVYAVPSMVNPSFTSHSPLLKNSPSLNVPLAKVQVMFTWEPWRQECVYILLSKHEGSSEIIISFWQLMQDRRVLARAT
jgi:hypothetical protein